MPAPTFLLRDRHGGYLFRRLLPKALRPYFQNRREYRKSLQTHQRTVALRRAREIAVKLDQALDAVERIDDMLYLKDEYQRRIEELVAEITTLYSERRQPFEEKLIGQPHAHQPATPETEADQDKTLHDLQEYVGTITPLIEEHKLLALKLSALEAHIADHQKAVGAALVRQELGIEPASHQSIPEIDDARLTDLSEKWLAQKANSGNLKERSEQTYRASLAKLFDIVGSAITSGELTKAKAVFYVDQLSDYPNNRWKGKGRAAMTLDEVRKIEPNRLSPSTIDDELQIISSFCEWLVQRGHLTSNVVRGLGPKVNNADLSREPFSREEVQQIFSHPCFRGEKPAHWHKPLRTHYYWMPLLALFTGARIEELARLRKKDIREIDGNMVIEIMAADLTPDVTSRRKKTPGKSAAASRLIPVHANLSALGFNKFVNSQPDGYLFDLEENNYRRSHSASRDLAKIFKEAGVEKSMHQLRHTMRDLLTEAGVDWAITQAIMGHSPGGQSAKYGTDIRRNIRAITPPYSLLSFSPLISPIRSWQEIGHLYQREPTNNTNQISAQKAAHA